VRARRLLRLDELALEQLDQLVAPVRLQRVAPQLHHGFEIGERHGAEATGHHRQKTISGTRPAL
jgi:hypothetical protein